MLNLRMVFLPRGRRNTTARVSTLRFEEQQISINLIGNIGAPLNHGALSILTNPRGHGNEYDGHTEGSDSVVYISENPLAAGIVQDDITVTDQTSDTLVFWEAI